VLAYDANKKLENATLQLKNNLKEYLEPFRMVTDAITIKNAFYINLGLSFDITVIPGLSNKQILTDCILALQNYFNIDKWQVNQPIIISEVYSILLQTNGVQSVTKVEFTNKSGNNYSPYSYDVAGAIRNNVLYPSLDPAIFEIRYPEVDIQGRVITF
jgi:phage-related baseplate assembly protein